MGTHFLLLRLAPDRFHAETRIVQTPKHNQLIEQRKTSAVHHQNSRPHLSKINIDIIEHSVVVCQGAKANPPIGIHRGLNGHIEDFDTID